MLSSFSSFRAQRLPSGVCLKSPEGRRIDVDIKDDGITLEGDGFAHSIRVEGDHIHVATSALAPVRVVVPPGSTALVAPADP